VKFSAKKYFKIPLFTFFSTFFPFQLHNAQPFSHKNGQALSFSKNSKISQQRSVDELFGVYLQKTPVPTFPPTQ